MLSVSAVPPDTGEHPELRFARRPGMLVIMRLVYRGPETEGQPFLIGLSFDDKFRAQEFLSAMTRLGSLGSLQLRDAVVVSKGDDGNVRVRETVDPQAGRSALSSAVWTGLLGLLVGGPVGWIAGIGIGAGAGAITAKVVDLGVPDEWVDWFRQAVGDGTTTVVILAEDVDFEALEAEARRFAGAELVHSTMPARALEQLRQALEPSDDESDEPTPAVDAGSDGEQP
jgi:uncharacterized membrane protein